MYNKVVCPACKGNGYIRSSWEGDDFVDQCKTCHSQGEVTNLRLKAYHKYNDLRDDKEWALAAAMSEDYEETHRED